MASTIKVDNVQNQPGTNIVSKCGTDVTLGASGDTVALAAGASQTGFGRTGTVDWITTPKVTGDSPITAVSGNGYFLNTTAGVITLNLPAGAAGSIVSMADYAATWHTNNVTVSPNGTDKIGSVNASVVLNTEGQSVTLVYVDSTQGWVNTMDSTSNVRAAVFIVATGGTPCSGAIVCTNYKVHTFTGPGTFCVSEAGGPGGSNTVDYMVIAGGASGGTGCAGGGGGAGGYRESPGTASGCYVTSPLGVAPAVALPVSATPYAIVVGAGGAGHAPGPLNNENVGNDGNVSSFSTISSAGGGGGGWGIPPAPGGTNCGSDGGSGGGGGHGCSPVGGCGNTPPTPVSQGNNGASNVSGGGPAPSDSGGGGGGAGAVGTSPPTNHTGGAGVTSSINATPTARAGGGGGTNRCAGPAADVAGGSGGGGRGGHGPRPAPSGQATGAPGDINTGSGGGGGSSTAGGSPEGGSGTGGSGIVIIRYKFQ